MTWGSASMPRTAPGTRPARSAGAGRALTSGGSGCHAGTVFGKADYDWRSNRRSAAQDHIVATAWELAREQGVAGLSLRDLARRLGMAPASLYSYFDSKHALYDAMYADGNRSLLEKAAPRESDDLRVCLRDSMKSWIDFALEDPVRGQLLHQRTIPGFEPSTESYALAQQVYDRSFSALERLLDLSQQDKDLITAMVAGLLNQQFANDPDGTRWVDLLDDVVELLLPRLEAKKRARPQPVAGEARKDQGS